MPASAHDIFNVFNTQMQLSDTSLIDFYPSAQNPALAKVRVETLDGREYLVVPMVMLVVGVHKGSNGSIYYPPQEISYSPKQWNMKPIIIEHPYNGGSGTDLEIYKMQAVGQVMKSFYENGKLKAEAWLDLEKVKEKCPEIIDHIKHGLPMEVSTGLTSDIFADYGVWLGEPYSGRIGNIRADHLAILPKKQGACSLSDGAGLLINAAHDEPDAQRVMHTYNAEYFPGSCQTDDIEAPEKKKQPNPKDKEPESTQPPPPVMPNPFSIETLTQSPQTVTGNFPPTPQAGTEPMIPVSLVQSMFRENLNAIIEGIRASKEGGVSGDTPAATAAPAAPEVPPPVVSPTVDPPPAGSASAADAFAGTEPEKEENEGGAMSETELLAVMPEVQTLIESLFHLLTKTKGEEPAVIKETTITNKPTVTTNNRTIENEDGFDAEADFEDRFGRAVDRLDRQFLKSGSTMTQSQYDAAYAELVDQMTAEAQIVRNGYVGKIQRNLTILTNALSGKTKKAHTDNQARTNNGTLAADPDEIRGFVSALDSIDDGLSPLCNNGGSSEKKYSIRASNDIMSAIGHLLELLKSNDAYSKKKR